MSASASIQTPAPLPKPNPHTVILNLTLTLTFTLALALAPPSLSLSPSLSPLPSPSPRYFHEQTASLRFIFDKLCPADKKGIRHFEPSMHARLEKLGIATRDPSQVMTICHTLIFWLPAL